MPLTVRLDPETEQLVDRTARLQGKTKSEVVREALKEYCARTTERQKTPYELAEDLIGSVEGGPTDLSQNVHKYVLEYLTRGKRNRR